MIAENASVTHRTPSDSAFVEIHYQFNCYDKPPGMSTGLSNSDMRETPFKLVMMPQRPLDTLQQISSPETRVCAQITIFRAFVNGVLALLNPHNAFLTHSLSVSY